MQRTLELDQSLELQRFNADCDMMDNWEVPYDMLTERKFETIIKEHEHDIKAIEESADELVKGKHYAALEISERKETMMAKCQVFRT